MKSLRIKGKSLGMLLLAGGVLLSGLLSGCEKIGEFFGEKQQARSAGAPEVAVVTIVPQRVVFTTEIAGRTSPFQIAEVRPQVGGIIKSRLFTEGSDVEEGAVLYQIDPATFRAQYDSAVAALARAEANLAPLRLKSARYRELVKINAVSRQEAEDVAAAYKQAQAEVGVQKAAVETARIRLGYTKVVAPISGRVGISGVTAGALVTEHQPAFLTTVQQLDPIYVDITQSSTEVLRLRRAMAAGRLTANGGQAVVRLRLEDGSAYEHTGKLQFTDVTVDKSTGAVTLRALFPNPEKLLLPNMYVRAEIVNGVAQNAILVPQRGVLRDSNGNASAYVVADGKVELRPIKVSQTMGDQWVVTEGLKTGDKVVVEGLQRIRPGVPVRIAGEGQAASPQK